MKSCMMNVDMPQVNIKAKSRDANMAPSSATVKMAVATATNIDGAVCCVMAKTAASEENRGDANRTIKNATVATAKDVPDANVAIDFNVFRKPVLEFL
eukprot:CAMPEP_0197838444 /NCGR_PEP_ID=MMETSP1437-20131217/36362_1 /TAXON_ID=49252 ORGANISM="Eucampia antarctica, Strain CCMP1452" /NCGR_SAMPLE_ID=MMETSP1437 /ASSEMBLY_ACC=CAM_ASM_001096 /LENGTH=97 /DNA_ID=CAMNT_0043446377 /DNA_START=18 /DNA_END=311 /DNA_ORIENTATION=-